MRTVSEGVAVFEVTIPADVAELMTAEETEAAALTGQTVVVRAIVSVITIPPVAERAGQLVTEAAQEKMVRTCVAKTVRVVCGPEGEDVEPGELAEVEFAKPVTLVLEGTLIGGVVEETIRVALELEAKELTTDEVEVEGLDPRRPVKDDEPEVTGLFPNVLEPELEAERLVEEDDSLLVTGLFAVVLEPVLEAMAAVLVAVTAVEEIEEVLEAMDAMALEMTEEEIDAASVTGQTVVNTSIVSVTTDTTSVADLAGLSIISFEQPTRP